MIIIMIIRYSQLMNKGIQLIFILLTRDASVFIIIKTPCKLTELKSRPEITIKSDNKQTFTYRCHPRSYGLEVRPPQPHSRRGSGCQDHGRLAAVEGSLESDPRPDR